MGGLNGGNRRLRFPRSFVKSGRIVPYDEDSLLASHTVKRVVGGKDVCVDYEQFNCARYRRMRSTKYTFPSLHNSHSSKAPRGSMVIMTLSKIIIAQPKSVGQGMMHRTVLVKAVRGVTMKKLENSKHFIVTLLMKRG